jgi:hypothetical protein
VFGPGGSAKLADDAHGSSPAHATTASRKAARSPVRLRMPPE